MNIAIRLFLGYFLIVGLAAWFLVSIFARELEPGVRQATEETLVDSANLLAELAADELHAGNIGHGQFAQAVARALERSPQALISGVSKNSVDARVYVTDRRGIVAFDSTGEAVGADYSQWRDVARVLRGEYGARSTRRDEADPQSSVMYVAAPVFRQGDMIGVLTVSKPVLALMPYADRARERVMRAGLVLLVISAGIGLLFTLWLTWSLNRLRDYALAVAEGKKVAPPVIGGRQLSVLAKSLALMREKLDGKHYVESYVQSLAHELKSPLSAVRGSAELLQEAPSAEDRQRFVGHIAEQTERMQLIIERLLALARIEQLQIPEARREIQLRDLIASTVDSRADILATRQLTVRIDADAGAEIQGDPFLLQQALANLLDNAIEFSPAQSVIEIAVASGAERVTVSVRDHGPGA
ncbi:MAG TPA: two-component system sensor histidine kinase CreC, partial [Rhodocyclaceae bacterium]|nr:two-component system sensor histidine kinase CreC [Rhodocyclaceae bacterium]